MSTSTTTSKVQIYEDNNDPLWKECVSRFTKEIKAMSPDSPTGYVRTDKLKMRVEDYNWFLLVDDSIILREKKNDEA